MLWSVMKDNVIILPPLVRDGGIDLPQYLQQKDTPNWMAVLYKASVSLEENSPFLWSLNSYTVLSFGWYRSQAYTCICIMGLNSTLHVQRYKSKAWQNQRRNSDLHQVVKFLLKLYLQYTLFFCRSQSGWPNTKIAKCSSLWESFAPYFPKYCRVSQLFYSL